MGYVERLRACMFAVILVLGSSLTVYAEESYQPRYQILQEDLENYTMLVEELGEYKVCEGDSLWNISEKFLGSGEAYEQLVDANSEVITNPDLIYPNMSLVLKRNVYVKKRTGSNGIKMEAYRFGTPQGWTMGILEANDAFANLALMGSEVGDVVCLVREKTAAGVKSLSNWENVQETIKTYAQKEYADRVSDLTFHHYQTESGSEIYLFSYYYRVDGELLGLNEDFNISVCQGICQTEHIQAEFTGFHIDEEIEDIVCYMAASFEELWQEGEGDFQLTDHNIAVEPSKPWTLPDIHNSFAWIEEFFRAEKSEEEESSEEKSIFLPPVRGFRR